MPKTYDTTLVRVAGNLLSGQPMALRKKRRTRLVKAAVATALAIRDEVIEQTLVEQAEKDAKTTGQ